MNPAFEIDDMLQISLDDLIQLRSPSVYLVKSEGDSMQGAGMYSGDLLIVDRGLDAKHGDIVIAAVNGEPVCKRMCREHGMIVLRSENRKYPSRHIMEGDTFDVWGVVRYNIHRYGASYMGWRWMIVVIAANALRRSFRPAVSEPIVRMPA